MADLCKQCADDLGFPDTDFAAPERGTLKEGEGWTFLCEGCGPTLVDDDGVCLFHDKHKENEDG